MIWSYWKPEQWNLTSKSITPLTSQEVCLPARPPNRHISLCFLFALHSFPYHHLLMLLQVAMLRLCCTLAIHNKKTIHSSWAICVIAFCLQSAVHANRWLPQTAWLLQIYHQEESIFFNPYATGYAIRWPSIIRKPSTAHKQFASSLPVCNQLFMPTDDCPKQPDYFRYIIKRKVYFITLMLLLTNWPIQYDAKTLKKWLKPLHMGTHLRVLSESFQMNTQMIGLI